MKYALQSDERVEATPKAIGVCPCCGTEMIAKCGNRKIWHWAHKTKITCDHWWENETQWHRDWKNCFSDEWQEVIHFSDDGEKHIADVKTPSGLVIEFQHSAIGPEEVASREAFYKNMIWIVDGSRLSREAKRLSELFHPQFFELEKRICYLENGPKLFPKRWLKNTVPVYFDIGDPDFLICLLPRSYYYFFYKFPKRFFTHEFASISKNNGSDFFTTYPAEMFKGNLKTELIRVRNHLKQFITVKRGMRFIKSTTFTKSLQQKEKLLSQKLQRAKDLEEEAVRRKK